MNKRDQKILFYLIEKFASTSSDLRSVITEIVKVEEDECIPPNLIELRTYCEDELDTIKADIHKLLNPKANYFTYVNLLTYIGVFNCVLLAVRSTVTGDVLMAGLAALFPFLIYLVRETNN